MADLTPLAPAGSVLVAPQPPELTQANPTPVSAKASWMVAMNQSAPQAGLL